MTISENVLAAARCVEAETGVAASALLAIALVETNAVAFAVFGERREPLIRFEGHYFDRLLTPERQARARQLGLSHPKAGAVRNPSDQARRWDLVDRAANIDEEAAFAACSWGLGQVMGAHWKSLGFTGAAALAASARSSIEGQLRLVANFLRIGRLDRQLVARNFSRFSRSYNGPLYRKNGYDSTLR